MFSHHQLPEFAEFYNENLRLGFFVGFLTVATFLFSALTQILFRMKSDVYDSDSYRTRYEKSRGMGNADDIYAPLRRFRNLLLRSIWLAFATSVLNVLILFIQTDWAAVACLSIAAVTLWHLFLCLFRMKQNLSSWIEHSEPEGDAEG